MEAKASKERVNVFVDALFGSRPRNSASTFSLTPFLDAKASKKRVNVFVDALFGSKNQEEPKQQHNQQQHPHPTSTPKPHQRLPAAVDIAIVVRHHPSLWLLAMVAQVELHVSLKLPEVILRVGGSLAEKCFSWEVVSKRWRNERDETISVEGSRRVEDFRRQSPLESIQYDR